MYWQDTKTPSIHAFAKKSKKKKIELICFYVLINYYWKHVFFRKDDILNKMFNFY